MTSRGDTPAVDLDELTWEAYRDRLADGAVVLVPVGATEQHGAHLPLGTDTMIAAGVCRGVASVLAGVVAPAIAYGFRSQPQSGGGQAFPGTTSVWGATLAGTVRDVVGGLLDGGALRIVVVNAHMENLWFVTDAIEQAVHDRGTAAKVLLCRWAAFLGSETAQELFGTPQLDWTREHAGVVETCLMLALRPELVRPFDAPVELPEARPYEAYPQPAAPGSSGSLSSPAGATAGKGERILAEVVAGISAAARAEFGIAAAA